jgi:hypothetical protein
MKRRMSRSSILTAGKLLEPEVLLNSSSAFDALRLGEGRADEGSVLCSSARKVTHTPAPQDVEDGLERATVWRKPISDPKSRGCQWLACDETIGDHLPKLFAQDFRRHARHGAP